ncbi:hypothetical protein OUZ56_021410 [Daphnia magna]|uniref:Paraneoplastic antigen Ma-like C-terminal domain-containing protein n=1 Tax=Daphnia magna TaxID=35525 RepID=A0ABQ9ZIB4_9CRUS|nr:hypothetical protein OUZ56_021410 [Daphnia magna]
MDNFTKVFRSAGKIVTGFTTKNKVARKNQGPTSEITQPQIAPDNKSPGNINLLTDNEVEEHNLVAQWDRIREEETTHLESDQYGTPPLEILRQAQALIAEDLGQQGIENEATQLFFNENLTTLKTDTTGTPSFNKQYADLQLEDVPEEEILHELLFLRELNCQPELSYEQIRKSYRAVIQQYGEHFYTPKELFRFLNLRTYLTPIPEALYPNPSPVTAGQTESTTLASRQNPDLELTSFKADIPYSVLTPHPIRVTSRGNPFLTSQDQETGARSKTTSRLAERELRSSTVATHRETPRNAENLPPPVPKRVAFTPQLSTTTRQNTTNTMNYNPRPQASTNSTIPEDDLVAVFRALTRNNWSTDEAANFVATLVGNNTTRASNPPQYTSTPNPTLWQNPMSSAIAPPWQNYRTTASTIASQPSYMASNTHQPQPHYGHHQSTISELDIQATRLLTQISVFSTPGNNADFNSWLRHFENTLDFGDFEESKKIKYLRSKLVGPAGDLLEQYQLDHPVEATCYETLKQALKERFMGKNMEHKYRTSFNSCKREPGESIRNFAHRIQKLARGGYPNVSHEVIEQLSRDKFMNGLAPQLHDRLFCKDFPSFDQMIETAERHDLALELINSRENPGTGDAAGPLARKEDEAKDISDLMREVIRSELAKNAETRRPERREPRNGQYDTSDKFCTYHNMYGHDTNNCAARQYQMRLVCEICGRRGHNRNSCCAPGNHPSSGQQPPNNPPPRDYYNQPPRPQQQQTPQYPPPTANNPPTNNTATGQLNE